MCCGGHKYNSIKPRPTTVITKFGHRGGNYIMCPPAAPFYPQINESYFLFQVPDPRLRWLGSLHWQVPFTQKVNIHLNQTEYYPNTNPAQTKTPASIVKSPSISTSGCPPTPSGTTREARRAVCAGVVWPWACQGA